LLLDVAERVLMDIICSYCKALIRTVESNLSGVSHGICRNCHPKLVKELGQPLSEFVDELSTPILVMREDTRIVAANVAARRLSPEPLEELSGVLCGDVIGCLHSHEEGGCGRTVHCLSCAIRRSVAHTFETGEPCHDVSAYQDIGLLSGDTQVCFRISTEKKGDFVLLRIDRVEETPKGDPSGS
jgi:PAS domain-containing protein